MGNPNKQLKPGSLSEAKAVGAYVGMAPFIRQRGYIGGTPIQARKAYWDTDNEMYILTDSVARTYGINPEILRNRLDREGYTDEAIKDLNYEYRVKKHPEIRDGNPFIAPLGIEKFNSKNYLNTATEEFGLDDVASYIENGKVKPINEKWRRGQFRNEKGRITNVANGEKVSDNIGLMAATLKYMRDKAKEDFPNASELDLDRYAGIYYNRGTIGGRKYINKGGKGYNIKRSLEEGGK